jgi:predicted short-subunit dehydrogenase-like oxidoreductase (DUF2520 family)
MEQINSIGFIGAGKVATQFATAFKNAGLNVSWVWSRTNKSASLFSSLTGCKIVEKITDPLPAADLVIISIKDDALFDIAGLLAPDTYSIVHTSGSVDINVLKNISPDTGVFYPLQTFSEGRNVSLKDVPVCIEASGEELKEKLCSLANCIGSKVVIADSEKRLCLHIAAVFACNFTNYMYALSEKALKKSGFDLTLLYPLILETTTKVLQNDPDLVQTGPAVRGDKRIIENHIAWLKEMPELKEVYELLSNQLMKKNDDGKL